MDVFTFLDFCPPLLTALSFSPLPFHSSLLLSVYFFFSSFLHFLFFFSFFSCILKEVCVCVCARTRAFV